MLRSRLWIQIAALLAAAALTGACVTDGDPGADDPVASRDASRARAHHSVGAGHLREGRIGLAIRELRAAEQLEPEGPLDPARARRGLPPQGPEQRRRAPPAKALALEPVVPGRAAHALRPLHPDGALRGSHRARAGAGGRSHLPDAVDGAQQQGLRAIQLGRRAEAREALELALEYHARYWPALLDLAILDAQEGKRSRRWSASSACSDSKPGRSAWPRRTTGWPRSTSRSETEERAVEHLVAASSQRPSGPWGKRSEDYLKRLR